MPPDTRFLATPADIRRQVATSLAAATSADLAVAYVRSAWLDAFAGFVGPARVICWLRCPNSDPFAIEQLTKREHTEVRHLDGMHAKVYIGHGNALQVITGSANLSRPALGLCGSANEAAIWTARPDVGADATAWFDELWASSEPVTKAALKAAQAAWRPPICPKGVGAPPKLPEKLPKTLAKLAGQVAGDDLYALKEEWAFAQKLKPESLKPKDLLRLKEALAAWMKHPATFEPLLTEAPAKVAAAMKYVFDEGIDIETRLRGVARKGPLKIAGMDLPSWTILLHWRMPTIYSPFDEPTRRFLRAFKLGGDLGTGESLSASKYARWLAFSDLLTQKLKLPTRGHVDRVVWAHNELLKGA